MRGNPDDLSHQLIIKIKAWLKEEIDQANEQEWEETYEDGILEGRAEVCESLLYFIGFLHKFIIFITIQ